MIPPLLLVIVYVRILHYAYVYTSFWVGYESYSMRERLDSRTFGKLKGAALKQAYKVVRDNGGLDISGEYGSLEVSDKDFDE